MAKIKKVKRVRKAVSTKRNRAGDIITTTVKVKDNKRRSVIKKATVVTNTTTGKLEATGTKTRTNKRTGKTKTKKLSHARARDLM